MRKYFFLFGLMLALVVAGPAVMAADHPWGVKGNLDQDGDGVYDYDDKCPNTRHCCTVDYSGCPLDADEDGVCEAYWDQCPGTPKGCIVNDRGCPSDGDGDGVCDGLDKCPNTPAGVYVDKSGCCLDNDEDGVCNELDKCPGTPRGVRVDAKGCCFDDDGDMVCNELDRCPGTPMAHKVDGSGCPISLKLVVMVHFDTDKSIVRPEYMGELERVIAFMEAYPYLTATIDGHTDSRASAEYNKALGQRRAEAVKDYLEAAGIAPSRLRLATYGENNPLMPNNSGMNMAKNRRVLVTVGPAFERR